MTAATAEKLVDDEAARSAGGVPLQIGDQVGVYSLARGLSGGGFEREVSQELEGALEDRVMTRGGIMVPPAAMFPRADLDTGTTNEGEEFVFDARPELVPARRPIPRVEALGATVVRGGSKNIAVARVTDGSTVTWVPEVPGSPVSDDDATLGSETLAIHQGMISTAYTRRLRALNPESVALVETELRAAAAQAVDEGAVGGIGDSDAPTGILDRSDVSVHSIADPDGGVPAYSDMTAMEEVPAAADVDELATGWLTTPGIRRTLRETQVVSGTGKFIWFGQSVLGHRAEVSSVVPSDLTKGSGTNLHGILFSADWSNLVVHILAVEILSDPFTEKKQGLVEATMFLHVGVGLRHPEAFVVSKDAETN